jgi:hypothetical protein
MARVYYYSSRGVIHFTPYSKQTLENSCYKAISLFTPCSNPLNLFNNNEEKFLDGGCMPLYSSKGFTK